MADVDAFVVALLTGDVAGVRTAVHGDADLAATPIARPRGGARTPLGLLTDWPGYWPEAPEIVGILIAAGADPDVPADGDAGETPLHWAASSDDVDVAAALIDAGADLEVGGGSIAGGAPLVNAVGYGCWHVARLLVSRGARVDLLWVAAALGLLPRLEELLVTAAGEEVSHAFWQACHGGQRRAAMRLLDAGADPDLRPDYSTSSALEVITEDDTRRSTMADWLRGVRPAH